MTDGFRSQIADRIVGRYNTSALATDAETLEAVTRELAEPYRDADVDLVVGIDALGLLYGVAVARHLEVGFVPIRKGGKLPLPEAELLTTRVRDYTDTEKGLELDRAAIEAGSRILLVDDWIETAAQMGGAVELVEQADGVVVGIAVLGAGETDATRRLDDRYGVHACLSD